MNPELLLLSTRIALLVLVASALAFLIGWRLRGGRPGAALVFAPANEPLTATPSEPQQEEIESLSAALASAEQQCLAALEQRDEAERVAHERSHEVRRLTEELEALRAQHMQQPRLPPPQELPANEAPQTSADHGPFPPAPPRVALLLEKTVPSVAVADVDLLPAQALVGRLADEIQELEQRVAALTEEAASAQAALANLPQSKPGDKAVIKTAGKQGKAAEQQLAQAAESLDRKRRQHRAVTRSLAVASSPLLVDDLTQIKGIKTVLNARLNEHGIFSYRQIAQWDEGDVLAFGELLAFKHRIVKDGWQAQARALHAAAHPELSEL